MITKLMALVIVLIAFVVSLGVYPMVLRFAKKHNVMDNPDQRKLQREPVPVMGGLVVFCGIFAAMLLASNIISFRPFVRGFICLTSMFAIGVWDDLKNIPPTLRFIFEIAVVYFMMTSYGGGIQNLRGLWEMHSISPFASIPLSIIAGVGIINAINLIDGVDGFASGFVIMASVLFAIMFYFAYETSMSIFALIGAAATVPFFLHNLFGNKSKMFIGDSGTLMMGTAMVLYVFVCLSDRTRCSYMEEHGLGLVAFTLAVLSVPVFDTLRVMGARIVRGQSPFQADKTHLHHLFIEMGFSHIGTTSVILSMNLFVVAIWFLLWRLGASIDAQLYVVAGMSLCFTFGFNKLVQVCRKNDNGFYRFLCRLGKASHIERKGFWLFMRNLVDGNFRKNK